MKWYFLGTGTLIPRPDRYPVSSLLEDSGVQLLVDAGPGFLQQAARLELDLFDVRHVLLTHYHQDHTAGLASLLAYLKFTPGSVRTEPLHISGPRSLGDFLSSLLGLYPELQPVTYSIVPATVPDWLEGTDEDRAYKVGPFRIFSLPVEHAGGKALGYRIRWKGQTLTVSGDSEECPNLEVLARDARVFLSECSFPTEAGMRGHMTPRTLANLCDRAQPNTLLIQHVYPPHDPENMVSQIRKNYAGEVYALEDLTVLTLDATGGLKLSTAGGGS